MMGKGHRFSPFILTSVRKVRSVPFTGHSVTEWLEWNPDSFKRFPKPAIVRIKCGEIRVSVPFLGG